MSEIMNSVNQRTQLVGQNRLELLLFRLNGRQKFGINVFKVREVLQCPKLTSIPRLNSFVRGVAHIRGQTISVIDMSLATGGKAIVNLDTAFVVIAEYNSSVQGFLVGAVERIINTNWEAIMPPPKGSGRASYLTAVTEFENELIEILDVEKILNEISPISTDVSESVSNMSVENKREKIIFIADDSAVARNQVKKALSTLGLEIEMAKNGLEALNRLKALAEETGDITDKVGILVSDIEMPEMDGYTLTAEIKNDPALKNLHVVLHTSLSGVFNQAMIQKVGADDFIAKFHPDELVTSVQKWFDNI
ncbi:chemotaxis protein CheV [Paraglaciecola polaris]|uniref:Two-component system, chemotaxis family, response regulator CheV n=1 Tax=Paraglaciecola polaris LMG 21857 TaxID=1129793 RepID=K7A0D5_9ALTE|nr:chemotaxis protein CheV [Paraglaciecola polaris]GAC34418.1 two-component system, chemotaxis family, response regulator CheV [Paraglaciecola polaris LMG 21857]|tara:strand:+ start:6248 stop:7168 length:921 start_codon:yes stop_codon:yes gene_type:complete